MKIIRGALIALVACGLVHVAQAGNVDAKISDSAIMQITQKNSPKIFAKWGPEYIARINKQQLQAARKVAASDRCDKVVWVALSDRRSTVKKEAVFLVHCQNNERFFVSEKELGGKNVAKSVQEIGNQWTDRQYIEACQEYTKKGFDAFPQWKYKFLRGGTSVYRAPGTGNVVVKTRVHVVSDKGAADIESSCTFNSGKMIGSDVYAVP
jgi:hypothetical protein